MIRRTSNQSTPNAAEDALAADLIRFVAQDLLNGQASEDFEVDEDLLATGLVDSLGMMRLVAHLEETHSISVPPEDVTIQNFRTIATIAQYVEGRRG